MRYIFIFLYGVFILLSCFTNKVHAQQSAGLIPLYIDTLIRPQDDMYRYVNGKWLDHYALTLEEIYAGVDTELADQIERDLLDLLKNSIRNKTYLKESDQFKAITLYEQYVDTSYRNELGLSPALPYLSAIRDIKSKDEIIEIVSEYSQYGIRMFLSYGVGADRKNSSINTVYLGPGMSGLPERAYYLHQDEETDNIRNAYNEIIQNSLQYFGYTPIESQNMAKQIVDFETKMANLKLSKESRRDVLSTYNPMSLHDLNSLAPSIDWTSYLKPTKLNAHDTIIVTQPNFLKGMDKLFRSTSLNELKSYMIWSFILTVSNRLTTDLSDLNWRFYSELLNGAESQLPIDKTALEIVNNRLGDVLGKVYVDNKFSQDSKDKVIEMVHSIIHVYQKRIQALDWLSTETKEKAIYKLKNMSIKIGYPDKWEDYSDLSIKTREEGGSYFDSQLNIRKREFDLRMKEIGAKVDKSKWIMTPQEIDAYYNPLNNEIVFPAAILQPPFFDPTADLAVNYGAIGSIIGHEISHAFDDMGARYDAKGNLTNWWSDEDFDQFKSRANKLTEQYSKLEVEPRLFVNGEFTLGENIADLAGVSASFDALQMRKNNDSKRINGYTQNELFFMSWAACWRRKMTDELTKRYIKEDPHSPAVFRVNMTIRNLNSFHNTFKTKKGDKMYLEPTERVSIW